MTIPNTNFIECEERGDPVIGIALVMMDSKRSENDRNAPCSPVFDADDEGNIYCTGCGMKVWIIRDEETEPKNSRNQ